MPLKFHGAQLALIWLQVGQELCSKIPPAGGRAVAHKLDKLHQRSIAQDQMQRVERRRRGYERVIFCICPACNLFCDPSDTLAH